MSGTVVAGGAGVVVRASVVVGVAEVGSSEVVAGGVVTIASVV